MPPTVLILIGGHLALAPRPQKEAAAAIAAGFRVVIRGVWWDDALAGEDMTMAKAMGTEFAPVMDLRSGGIGMLLFRAKQRAAKEIYQRLGWASPRSLGLAAPEMLKVALRLRPRLTMVHSEAGLWVGEQLLKRGFRVGVDFEDWFSEDLPPQDRVGRPVAAIKRLERTLLRGANPTIATTRVMARNLAKDSSCKRLPEAIPNSFPWAQASPASRENLRDQRDPSAVSFYWFSQTIGPGRGLESLAKALPGLKGNWQLHLRGSLRNYGTWFDSTFPREIRNRVMLQDMVPNFELRSRSASHDVGLALEVPLSSSRDLTATNKIFEYLRCGLAVIATATQGQIEVMEQCPRAGWVIAPDDVANLLAVMQGCLDDPARLKEAQAAASEAAAGPWAWEKFEPRLQQLIREAVDLP